ncbi:MAG: TraR/DksA C4-type zinc finger protein [Gemmatimonadota bacterium]
MIAIAERALRAPLNAGQLAALKTELQQDLQRLTLVTTNTAESSTLGVRSQARAQLVLAALARMAAKTFGTCRRCRGPIPYQRLSAIPEATTCVECTSRTG